jgi:hypothetical protein
MDDYESLRLAFQSTAEWRRQKAVERPEDTRNATAAEILDHLAATTKDVVPEILEAYVELFEDLPDTERHEDLLREVGFHWEPESASEFVSRFIKEATGG